MSGFYETCLSDATIDRAAKIRHLARVGAAASQSSLALAQMDLALVTLFELMAELASQIEDDLEGGAA